MTAPNDRDTREVSIIGLAASGIAAARLALREGEKTHVSDLRDDDETRAHARFLRELGADVELGGHDVDRIAASRLVIVSPGIPPHAPVLRELHERGVRWIGEPEYAVRFLPGALIAVTGTNGKTTTTLLLAHLLREGGLDAEAGGNVGGGLAPAASELALRDPPPVWSVIEMSSYQLADTDRFRPDIGVVTNLAPDHMERYADTASYFADKSRLFRNADAASRWVLNGESDEVRDLPGDAPGVRLLFARDRDASAVGGHGVETSAETANTTTPRPGEAGVAAFLEGDRLTLRIPTEVGGSGAFEPLLAAGEVPLLGAHNLMNALAAALAARLVGVEADAIAKGLRSFRPLPHRMEPVAEIGGVLWVNDSKATNVAAARTALENLDRPAVLLLGGFDREEDFRPLAAALVGRVRVALLFGASATRLEAELDDGFAALNTPSDTPEVRLVGSGADSFDTAVRAAREVARAGEVVLLSPACQSFDAFRNYGMRGDRFRALVLEEAA